MKITNFRGIKGIIIKDTNEIKEALKQEGFNIYGLRHSDDDIVGNSPSTIEENIVQVNSFGVFVTPSKIDFKDNDYMNLTTGEKISFGKSMVKKYTQEELLKTIQQIKDNNIKVNKPKKNVIR